MTNKILTMAQDFENMSKKELERNRKILYDRRQTVERAIEHGKIGPVPERQKGRIGGGGRERIHMYDLDSASFAGLVDKLGEKINSSANTARQAVTQTVVNRRKVHNELKPFVDAVAKAIQKNDSGAKLAALKTLKSQMKIRVDKETAIKALSRNIKWLPFFQRMKSDLELIANQKLVLIDGTQNLNENQISFIQHLLRNGRKITEAYRKHYPETGPQKTNQLEISFDNTTKYLDAVLDQLAERTGITE